MTRRRRLVLAILLLPALLFVAMVASNAVAKYRVAQRIEFWGASIHARLPVGSDASAVEAFGRGHGLAIRCSATSGKEECSALDKVGFGTLPTWHVWLTFNMRDGKLVDSKLVAVGVGL